MLPGCLLVACVPSGFPCCLRVVSLCVVITWVRAFDIPMGLLGISIHHLVKGELHVPLLLAMCQLMCVELARCF